MTTSASRLDPHIAPAKTTGQIAGVAKARGIAVNGVRALLDASTESRLLGVFGEPRVNVLKLNLSLDEPSNVGVVVE